MSRMVRLVWDVLIVEGKIQTPSPLTPLPRGEGEAHSPLTPLPRGEGEAHLPLAPTPRGEAAFLPSPCGRRAGDEGDLFVLSNKVAIASGEGARWSAAIYIPSQSSLSGGSRRIIFVPFGEGRVPSPPTPLPWGEGEALSPPTPLPRGEGEAPSPPTHLPWGEGRWTSPLAILAGGEGEGHAVRCQI